MINPFWLAGFFDGEGCCSISVYSKFKRKHGFFSPIITITQSEHLNINVQSIFNNLAQKFNGTITIVPVFRNNKKQYNLRLTSRKSIKEFTNFIYENSIIKHNQLQLMMEFLGLKKSHEPWQGKALLRGLKIAYEISKLNDRNNQKFLNRLSELIKQTEREIEETMIKIGNGITPKCCKFCGTNNLVKDGFSPHNKQRYSCKNCNRKFVWPFSLEIQR